MASQRPKRLATKKPRRDESDDEYGVKKTKTIIANEEVIAPTTPAIEKKDEVIMPVEEVKVEPTPVEEVKVEPTPVEEVKVEPTPVEEVKDEPTPVAEQRGDKIEGESKKRKARDEDSETEVVKTKKIRPPTPKPKSKVLPIAAEKVVTPFMKMRELANDIKNLLLSWNCVQDSFEAKELLNNLDSYDFIRQSAERYRMFKPHVRRDYFLGVMKVSAKIEDEDIPEGGQDELWQKLEALLKFIVVTLKLEMFD